MITEIEALRVRLAEAESARCPDPECHEDHEAMWLEARDARAEVERLTRQLEAETTIRQVLERQLDAARAMLRKHEWCGPRTGGGILYSGVSTCIECGNSRTADGHRLGCPWAAAAGEETET